MVVSRFLESMARFHEALNVWKYVVMPDHVCISSCLWSGNCPSL